jgi:hypothetical protein
MGVIGCNSPACPDRKVASWPAKLLAFPGQTPARARERCNKIVTVERGPAVAEFAHGHRRSRSSKGARA